MSDAVERVARAITWALCANAGGAGPGKCDPEHCNCGQEGRAVARAALEAIRDLDAETLAHVVPRPDHLITARNDAEYTVRMEAATLADRAAFLSQWKRAIDKMMGS
jgi:hypothetical protein